VDERMKRLRKMKNSYNGKNDMSRLTALAALAAVLAILTVLSACGSGAEGGGTTAAGQQAQAKTTGPTDGAGSGDAGAGGSGSGTNIELPSTLRIGFISPTNKKLLTGPEGWAQNIGLLEKELGKYGVTSIEVYNFPNGPNLNEALAAGSIDVGIYGDTPAINAKSAGLNPSSTVAR
jgi:ABC-type phosphate/phosphonate transport system substrate-binding protein